MIRNYNKTDLDTIMSIWLESNLDAHPFISEEYWRDHYEMVKTMLPQSDLTLYEQDGVVVGFMGIQDNYIAGVFVAKRCRSQGIGKELLNDAKKRYDKLSLDVYVENERAVAFYLNEGFKIQEKKSGKQAEYFMVWQ